MTNLAIDQPATVVLRAGLRRDVPFITSAWLRSYRRVGARGVDPRVYHYWHHKLLERIMPSPADVRVAHDRSDPDRIVGWGCARYMGPTLVIHYLYVRDGWRRQRIASAILNYWRERYDPTSLAWTHQTDAGKRLIKATAGDIPGIFNPYLSAHLAWAEERP